MQKQANLNQTTVTIGGMITPILLACGWEEGDGQPYARTMLMDLQTLVSMHFTNEVIPPFWFWMTGDKPFHLPNEALVYTADFSCNDI